MSYPDETKPPDIHIDRKQLRIFHIFIQTRDIIIFQWSTAFNQHLFQRDDLLQ